MGLELKPCPFCGGEAMIFVCDSISVMCKKCHCQTRPRSDETISNAEKFNSFEAVVKEWNARPKPIAPYEYDGTWYCGDCNQTINKGDKFCNGCGKAVKW